MKICVRLAVMSLAWLLGSLVPALPHGGTYRGPGGGIGPGGPAGPSTPGGGAGGGPSTGAADAAGDLTAWQQWWALNRDGYLGLRAALIEGGDSLSRSDAFFQGQTAVDPHRPTPEFVRDHVVPVLLESLAKESSPDVVTALIFALARIGEGQSGVVAAALTPHIASANQEISETAVLGLGLLADPRSSADLVALLSDSPAGRKLAHRDEVPTRTRAFAAYGLGLLGRNATNADVRRFVVHHLSSALEADTSSSYDVPVACIVSLGLVPLEPLVSQGKDLSPTASRSDQIAFLEHYLADGKKPESVRIFVPVALARLAGSEGPLRPLVTATCCNIIASGAAASPAMHQSAVMALGITADGDDDPIDIRARNLLRHERTQGDRLARRLALISIARSAGRAGVKSGWQPVLDEARAFLGGELARGTTPERPWVGLALGILEHGVLESGGTASALTRTELITAIADHPSPVEAGAYALGLGLFAGQNAGKMLLDLLEVTRDDQVRSQVAVALGMARISAGVEPLRKLAVEARYQPNLLRETSIGLGLLGDKAISPVLVDMMRDAQGLSAQAAIATALGYVGDARAIDPLLSMALDPLRSKGCQAFAIVAVGLICDRRLLPWNTMLAADVNYWLPPGTLLDPLASTGVLDIL
jgi:HEAT repeat protein